MMKITQDKILGGSFAVLASLAAQAREAAPVEKAPAGRPNIVLVIADDCRMRDLGFAGNANAITPNLDHLASESLSFTCFFQATAMSSATRQCLLTGMYPVHSGAYPNHTFINDGVETLPSYLKEAGYRAATQGKRHYSPLSAYPFEYLDGIEKNGDPALNPSKVEPFLKDVSEKGDPFFLYLCSIDPHSPWTRGDRSLFNPSKITLPSNLVDTPETRREYCNYLAEINQLDRNVGEIDALLTKYGLRENTIFIFTSEQGYSFPFGKWTCYDEGLQTAFLVRWPGVTTPGSTTDAMCEYVDVTPTIVDIAGGKQSPEFDGRSFKKVILGKKNSHKKYVYGAQTSRGIIQGPDYYGIRRVRDSKFDYIVNLTPDARFRCTTFKNKFFQEWIEKGEDGDSQAAQQAERYAKRPAEELYDIVNDPLETNNLAEDPAYAGVKKKMRGELSKWMKSQGDEGQATEMKALDHMTPNMRPARFVKQDKEQSIKK